MMESFVAALATVALISHLHVVDERGAPVAGATVVFTVTGSKHISEVTGKDGTVSVPSDVVDSPIRISADGFVAQTDALPSGDTPLVLHPKPGVIGKVSVATGSSQSLHELAVPAATLDGTTIATTSAIRSDQLLAQLPGFDFVRDNSAFTNYGDLRVSFSGAGEDRGVVLADDVPAKDGFGGQVDWLAYPPVELSSVELLRGPGAALYGADAVGGVLELRSFSPSTDWRAAPGGFLDVADGTHHTQQADLGFNFTLAPHVTAAVSTETNYQAYEDLPSGYTSPIDQEATATSTATRAQIRYGFGNSSLDIGGLFTNDAQFEGRPSYTFARSLDQGDLHFTTTSANATFAVTAYDRTTTIINTDDESPTDPGVLRYVQNIPTREAGVAASYFLTQGDNEIVLRADEKHVYGDSVQDTATGALQSSGTGDQQYAGLAAEDTYEHGRFEFIGGVRGDLVSLTNELVQTPKPDFLPSRVDRVLSPRVAGRYNITPGFAIRASTGTGFREPYLNELLRGYRIGAVAYDNNPNLTPERSDNFGFGADALVGSGRLSLDFSETRVHNAIEFVTTAPNVETRENVARTQTDSTTLTYTTQIAHCTRLRAYGTTQYGRIIDGPLDDIGNRLAYVPNRSADVGITTGTGALSYGADVGYAGVAFGDDLNTEVLPAALLLGAHVTRPLGDGAELTLEGSNLNGDRYLSSIDRYGPPPTVSLKLHFALGQHPQAAVQSVCP